MEEKIELRKGSEVSIETIPELLIETLGGNKSHFFLNGERFGKGVTEISYTHIASSKPVLTIKTFNEEEYDRIKEIASTAKITINAIKDDD